MYRRIVLITTHQDVSHNCEGEEVGKVDASIVGASIINVTGSATLAA